MITLLLCVWDLLPQPLLYVSAFFEQNRQEYYDKLLAVSQRGEWEQWLGFFLTAVATQAKDALARINRLTVFREEIQAKASAQPRAPAGIVHTVDSFFSQPVTTITELANRLNIPYYSANRNIALLEKIGFVREMTGKARNRVYIADQVLQAIESPV